MVKGVDVTEFGGPKRGQSGFFMFGNTLRTKLIKEAQDAGKKVDIGAVGKEVGAAWGKLGEEEKKPYQEKAELAKVEYEAKMVAWKKTDKYEEYQDAIKGKKDKDEKKQAKKRKKEENKDAPKKPQTAYFLFLGENRERITKEVAKKLGAGAAFGAVGKAAAEAWKALSPEQKKPFEDKHKAAKEPFDEAMAVYKQAQKDKKEEEEANAPSPKKAKKDKGDKGKKGDKKPSEKKDKAKAKKESGKGKEKDSGKGKGKKESAKKESGKTKSPKKESPKKPSAKESAKKEDGKPKKLATKPAPKKAGKAAKEAPAE